MKDFFAKRYKRSSDIELLRILEYREKYEEPAVQAALEELQSRSVIHRSKSDITYGEVLEIKERLLEGQKEEDQSSFFSRNNFNPIWEWLPGSHIIDLIGYYALGLIIILAFSFPVFPRDNILYIICFVLIFVPLWQVNIIARREKKRSYHLHARGVFAIALTFLIAIKNYLVKDNAGYLATWIFLFLVFFALSGIHSLIAYHVKFKKLSTPNWYFLDKLRFAIPVALLLLLVLVGRKEGWLKSDRTIQWDESRPLTYDDFSGYPDVFSEYDGAISSNIWYEDDDEQITALKAVCFADHSWIGYESRGNSYLLLQHEQYHFNITELVTRQTRKMIYDTLQKGAQLKAIHNIIIEQREVLDVLQDQYDTETDHSIILDQQSLWQFKIDSSLTELDCYASSDIFNKRNRPDSIRYYRDIRVDEHLALTGFNPLMPLEEEYTAHYRLYYSPEGHVKEVRYYANGKPSKDPLYNAFIIKRYFEEKDVIWEFYDQKGNPITNAEGYFRQVITISNSALVRTYFDIKGQACMDRQGVYRTVFQLDNDHMIQSSAYYDLKGRQIRNGVGDYALKYRYARNDRGEHIAYRQNYGPQGQPLNDHKGIFETIQWRDQHGNVIREEYKNAMGNPSYANGYAIITWTYDELGNMTSVAYYDENEQLIENEEGIAKITYATDRYGNMSRYSTYNANGVLDGGDDEIASTYKNYNKRGQLTSWADYGTGGDLIYDESGFGKAKYTYDSEGRRTQLYNLNGYDYPVCANFYGRISVFQYDSLGNEQIVYAYNADNQKDTMNQGAAGFFKKHDEQGRIIEERYFDPEGELKTVEEDIAIFRYQYDEKGNEIGRSFYNEEEKPALGYGISAYRYEYDENNRKIEESYYDTLAELVMNEGKAKIRWKYDDRGNVIEKRFYDPQNQLVKNGTAIEQYDYDKANRKTEERMLDHRGMPVTGPAITRYQYDKWGNVAEKTLFNGRREATHDEQEVHRYSYQYVNKTCVEERYYDRFGELQEIDGIAVIKRKADHRGNVLEVRFYNDREQLTAREDGVAVIYNEFDAYDRLISQQYFRANELPALIDHLYHKITYQRLPSGHITQTAHFYPQGELAQDEDSVSVYVRRFNRNFTVQEEIKYNLEEATEKFGKLEDPSKLLTVEE